MFPKRYADAVARLRVPFGFVLVVAFAWLSHPSAMSLAVGFPVAALGLALRAWAAGHLEKNSQLAESGPYRFVRNPLYAGTLLVAAGLAVASRRWLLGAVFAVVFLCVYLPVIQLEEQHLRGLFPKYEDYAMRVPALLPWGGERGDSTRRFRWALYVRNREYEALVGLLVGAAFLVGKLFW
jgi:protein-S-isoprenylcysteine O-methyltransferase Ste14